MTELENNIPSVYIIIPLAGVPGFPQDTAVNKRLKKIYQNFHDRWLTGKKKKETSFNSSSFKKAIASFTKKMFNRCILDLISYFCLLIWSLYLLFFFFFVLFSIAEADSLHCLFHSTQYSRWREKNSFRTFWQTCACFAFGHIFLFSSCLLVSPLSTVKMHK